MYRGTLASASNYRWPAAVGSAFIRQQGACDEFTNKYAFNPRAIFRGTASEDQLTEHLAFEFNNAIEVVNHLDSLSRA
jgi:hypothetical protein